MSFVHVVQPGDTLSKIIQNAGGTWMSKDWRDKVLSLNPHIKNPDRIDIYNLILVPDHPREMVFQDQVDYVSTVKSATRDDLLKREIERFARKKEEAERKRKFLARIDAIPGMQNTGIVYHDQFGTTIVIREPSGDKKKTLIVQEAPIIDPVEPVNDKLATDITNSILSCSAAIIGVVGILSGAVLVPFSGGASTAFVVLSYVGTAGSLGQCVNSTGRITAKLTGHSDKVDWLDSQEWYVYTTLALDGMSLAGVAGATATTIKTVLALKRASGGKTTMEVLKGLNREQRKKLAKEMAELQHPGITKTAMKKMFQTGAIPRRFTQVALTRELQLQILSVFGSGVSVIGSGFHGLFKKAGSKAMLLFVEEVVTE